MSTSRPKKSIDVVSLRLVRDRKLSTDRYIKTAGDAAYFIRMEMQDFDREHFAVLNLDSRMRPVNLTYISVGSLDSAYVHPREVFKTSILSSAASVILLHNHPSGIPNPSRDDDEVTKKLIRAGKLLGIPVCDHIIVGDNTYYSYIDSGRFQELQRSVEFEMDSIDAAAESKAVRENKKEPARRAQREIDYDMDI